MYERIVRKSIIILLLAFAIINNAQAQESPDFWMLKQLLKDSSFKGELFVQSMGNQKSALFWPKDLKTEYYHNIDIIIKNKNGLFVVLEGSERVYQVSTEADQLYFTRRDSTTIYGRMYGKFIYSYNDTIHSLGGYDLRNYSAELKYLKEFRWAEKKLNKSIPLIYLGNNVSYNQKNHSIFFVTDQWPIDRETTGIEKKVFHLDLKTNQWQELGTPTSIFLDLISYSSKIATLPSGTFVLGNAVTESSLGRHTTALFDYEHNKIFVLKDTSLSNTIFDLLYEDKKPEPFKVITYFKDSTLTILSSQYQKKEILLKQSDFIELDVPIYIATNSSIWKVMNLLWLGVSVALSLSILGFFFLVKHKSKYPYWKDDDLPSFIELEAELIKHFMNSPEHRLSVDEVDQVLGTSKKSKDVQNQKRSSFVRSINNKFMRISGTEINLIYTSRLVYDRRMIEYVLDPDQFKMIEHVLK